MATGNPKFSPPAEASGSGLAPSSLILGRILGSGPPLQVWDQVLEEFRKALVGGGPRFQADPGLLLEITRDYKHVEAAGIRARSCAGERGTVAWAGELARGLGSMMETRVSIH